MNSEVTVEARTENNLIWYRGLYMLLFLIVMGIAKGVVFVVAVVQFILVAVNKSPNEPLMKFGQGLSTYLYDINQYLVFNTERKPFPFDDWKSEPPEREEIVIDQDMEYQDGQ
ncbi:MAG: DUF4389 domain-containing protein [Sedimenticola sp.]|uniref:DUF4389 domain-containing protein n=1 Tax=Sedimenticola thiotaurini TaxID=1543721 RepID=A0A558DAI4_9GAMM|nr:DUF4389 domain-containing protein [Sedimenticola sp.]TVT58020.1 MAG: DUF4389 domain-containing protein [Sedimenticola thiotaurini]MCW8881588.1 DUF4389 domain-containing protein [Sedimenticola sp.]MCW8921789.1 DUF4389 domain-containing protein [Sedimenticola sp.]MCW8946292.1 DUF4389 domain-containing protein [Sedimenticola sp.]